MILMENRSLASLTTFGIGGAARWFVEVHCEDDLLEAAKWAQERAVRLLVLGGGSNLLISDAGFDGLVMHICLKGITASVAPGEQGQVVYRVAAGEDWDGFVERTVRDNCAGVECLAGIPGTVGGTPVQNVGAYGQEVASLIDQVRAYDLEERTFVEFNAAECGFAYRRSRFNSICRGRYVVTQVDYRLNPGGAAVLRYVELQLAFAASGSPNCQPTLAEVADIVRGLRKSKGMLLVDGDPDCRSAGSFFKNPVIDADALRQMVEKSGKEPPSYPADAKMPNQVKVPAAWLIEHAGFTKGYQLGAAGVSSRHTLALINRGGATATEILALAGKIRAAVEDQFGIRLEMEPVMVGF
jgi:UDP-N-acetylmuramate dehydrogenase